ncbi:MAG TPA: 50S ribosomal protein L29 [Candidatus Bathyarchaeia archaeon]
MPIMRLKEIDGMSSEERAQKVVELKAELSRLRTMISAGGAVDNPARIKELRKTVARLLTVEREKNLGIRAKEEKPSKMATKTKEKKKK